MEEYYSKKQSQKESDDERGVHDSKRKREDSQQSDTFRVIRSSRSLVHLRNDIAPCLGGLVQRLVREELDRRLFPRPSNNQIGVLGTTKPLQLVFKNELPATTYTNSKIKAPLEVVLFDIESNSIVAVGSLSSIKIQICVLNDEFGSNGREDWSADEFNANISRPREDKGQLLKGDTVITLENGVGYITNLEFTYSSKRTRTGRFRLGAKVFQSNLKDYDAISIREAISSPITVKSRGETNQKHDTPTLNDEIWHLKHISKNTKIYERLSSHGINTVEDLLKEHENNPSSLQEKFGKLPKKGREDIIKQAKKAKHATFDGQNYHSENNTLISDPRLETYKIWKDPVPIETKTLTPVTAQYGPAPNQYLQQQLEEDSTRLMDSLVMNLSEFVDGNIWPDADVSQMDQYISCSTPPHIFPRGDEAECSNHSSFPNSESNKGKSKML